MVFAGSSRSSSMYSFPTRKPFGYTPRSTTGMISLQRSSAKPISWLTQLECAPSRVQSTRTLRFAKCTFDLFGEPVAELRVPLGQVVHDVAPLGLFEKPVKNAEIMNSHAMTHEHIEWHRRPPFRRTVRRPLVRRGDRAASAPSPRSRSL